jgi:hypothetical protein
MDNTKQDFESRKLEIDNYFKFLRIFDSDETMLNYKQENELITERIQPQFLVTLRANTFLILYNLIESTIRNSIIEIYSKIEEEEVTYELLSDNLKKIWIKQTSVILKEQNFKSDTLRNYIFSTVNDILNRETIKLIEDKIDFSGNLDAQKIRELAENYGFKKPRNGRNLIKIKDKRNKLAHGKQTFYDVGKDFTVNDLTKLKDETFNFLADIIVKIENFINNDEYKKK